MFKRTVTTLQSFRHHFILFASIIAIVLVLNPPRAGAAGGGHYSILAATMQPVDSTVKFNSFSGYLVTTGDSTESFGSVVYYAPVNLPDGALISAVRVYGIDSDPSVNFSARMVRYNQDDPSLFSPVTDSANTSGLGDPGKVMISPAVVSPVAPVDNSTYSYAVWIYLPKPTVVNIGDPDLGVLRIVIDWSYTVYLPAVSR